MVAVAPVVSAGGLRQMPFAIDNAVLTSAEQAFATDPVEPTAPASTDAATAPPVAAPSSDQGSQTGTGSEEMPDIIIVTARADTPGDPIQDLNAQTFKIAQSIDTALVGPVSIAYRDAVPRPIRKGLHNFLYNLGEPVVFVNFLLQLKIGKAAETLGRFAINSTIGVAGVFDVAKLPPVSLPHRPNGFAYTLGYYGVDTGPYLYLPLIGPTTVRDLTGRMMDLMFLPLAIGKPFNDIRYTLPAGSLNALDDRIEFDDKLEEIREADDPYTAMREYYLKQRQAEIDELRGIHPHAMPPLTDLQSPAPDSMATVADPVAEPGAGVTAPLVIDSVDTLDTLPGQSAKTAAPDAEKVEARKADLQPLQ